MVRLLTSVVIQQVLLAPPREASYSQSKGVVARRETLSWEEALYIRLGGRARSFHHRYVSLRHLEYQ